jgi:thiol-disulfide isomerase/thioredoxin
MLFVSLCGQSKLQYEINISIPELKDSTLFLAYHYGDKQYINDTLKLDSKGKGTFTGTESLPKGIYLIVLPGNSYFEILASDDQFFSISCSYPDYINTLKFESSSENSSFLEYQKKWQSYQLEANSLSRRLQNNRENSDSLRILNSLLGEKEREMKGFLRDVVVNNQPNLLSLLVKSVIPLEIPEPVIPEGSPNPDSIRWYYRYNYNKDHFWDNIDLTDDRILRTPILQSRLETFFSNIVIQSPDSINKEIDKLIKKCEPQHDMFQYISVFLFNKYRNSEIMGQDAVLYKIAKDIYLSGKADWVSDEFLSDLAREVELMGNNLIGMRAKDLVMNSYNNFYVSLYDIKKEFTILYFWEPNCGYCKTTTPQLIDYYTKAKDEDVEIFAVCTTDNKEEWEKYIQDNNITWINGWDPDRTTHFDYYYNVQATPLIYILDREKTIIAKKLAVEDLASFISNYRLIMGG